MMAVFFFFPQPLSCSHSQATVKPPNIIAYEKGFRICTKLVHILVGHLGLRLHFLSSPFILQLRCGLLKGLTLCYQIWQ